MNEKLFSRLLKPFGLYKTRSEYFRSEHEYLKRIEGELNAAGRVADSGSRVVKALREGDEASAVETLLKFCEIGQSFPALQEIQTAVHGGERAKDAMTVAPGATLIEEIALSSKQEVENSLGKLSQLQTDIEVVTEEVNRKVVNLEKASEDWSLGEKMGTPQMVQRAVGRVQDVESRARRAAQKLEAALKALDGLRG